MNAFDSQNRVICYLGLGSNLGNRSRYLTKAIKILENNSNIWIQKKSSVIETKPYGYTNQPDFLNCVIEISTTLPAEELLHFCLQTENSLGRKRKEKWGARTIDIEKKKREMGRANNRHRYSVLRKGSYQFAKSYRSSRRFTESRICSPFAAGNF
ncbi:MAG: 2-amino-4-hydroxy-6-hydroxymethyldihydropteridine diphosphokinase, partial [Candidatus Cloacimonas sp. 4484_275]